MIIVNAIYNPGTDDNIKRFRTYFNYLKSIKDFLINEYGNWQDYGSYCISETQKVQRIKELDINWINRWLKIAWNTEYIINAGPEEVDLVRINNQWLPIKGYYCIYAATEAITYAQNIIESGSHAKAIKKISEHFEHSNIKPWNFFCDGIQSNIVHKNFPGIQSIPCNLLQNNIIPHEMIAKCLQAEHRHRIDENFVKRRGLYKKYFNPGITTLFHFFYKIRIKSNYRDIDLFIFSASDQIIIEFADSYKDIVFWYLLYVEIYLARRCGKKEIEGLKNAYLSSNPNHKLLINRFDFLLNTI